MAQGTERDVSSFVHTYFPAERGVISTFVVEVGGIGNEPAKKCETSECKKGGCRRPTHSDLSTWQSVVESALRLKRGEDISRLFPNPAYIQARRSSSIFPGL